jgi:hypothetical protein
VSCGDRARRRTPAVGAGTAAGPGRSVGPGEGVGVGLDDIDLPGLPARTGHPDLVLEGVAAGGVRLRGRGQAGFPQPVGGGGDLVGAADLHTEVVQAGVLTGLALDQDQLERGLGNGEVGVAGAELGGSDPEQRGVEGNRRLQVRDPEVELVL